MDFSWKYSIYYGVSRYKKTPLIIRTLGVKRHGVSPRIGTMAPLMSGTVLSKVLSMCVRYGI